MVKFLGCYNTTPLKKNAQDLIRVVLKILFLIAETKRFTHSTNFELSGLAAMPGLKMQSYTNTLMHDYYLKK